MTDEEIIAELKSLYTEELKIVARSVELIVEVIVREIDLEYGMDTYAFIQEIVGYPKDMAYARLRAAEIIQIAPEFLDHLRSNRVSMTSLKQARIAFNQENHRRRKAKEPYLTIEEMIAVLNQILNSSTRDTERILAEEFPLIHKTKDRVKPLPNGRVLLQVVMTAEEYMEFERFHARNSNCNPENRFAVTILLAIKRATPKPQKPKHRPAKEGRARHSVHVLRAIDKEAGEQCTHVGKNGHRCRNRYFLQTDHAIPLAMGGTNEMSNLRKLCAKHNRHAAKKMGLWQPDKHPPH